MVNLDDLPPQKPELGVTLVKADLEDNIYPQPKPYVPTEYKGGWIGLTQKARHKFSAVQPRSENQSNLNQDGRKTDGKACTLPARHQYNNYWPTWDDESVNDCEDQGVGDNTWKFEDNKESESDHWTTEGRRLIRTKQSTQRNDSQHFVDGQDSKDEYQEQGSVEQDGSIEADEEREENIHRYDSSEDNPDQDSNIKSDESLKSEKGSVKSNEASKGSGDSDTDEKSDTTPKRSWDEIADALTGNSDEDQKENSENKEDPNDIDDSLDQSDSVDPSPSDNFDDSVPPSDSVDQGPSDNFDDPLEDGFKPGDEGDAVPDFDEPQQIKSPSSSTDAIPISPPSDPLIDPPGPTMPPPLLSAAEPLIVYVFKAIRDIFWCILGP